MPITNGIHCAYCNAILPSDSMMDIHLKQHEEHIDSVRSREESREELKQYKTLG